MWTWSFPSRAEAAPREQLDFDALFLGHARRVVRLAALLGADDPEDVAQEAFCRLYAARERLEDDGDGSSPT